MNQCKGGFSPPFSFKAFRELRQYYMLAQKVGTILHVFCFLSLKFSFGIMLFLA